MRKQQKQTLKFFVENAKNWLSEDVFNNKIFDFIWTNGVLHHTENPSLAFDIICKYLKKEGYILVGLYNKYGRLRTVFRRFLYKIFGSFIVKIMTRLQQLFQQRKQIIF